MSQDNTPERDGIAIPEPANDTLDTSSMEGGPEARVAALEAEVAQLRDQHLRALAEVENVRRRGQRDKDESVRYAAANFAKDLLTVADNLRRAIASVPPEVLRQDGPVKALAEGVELVERDLLQAFQRHGIKAVDKVGEKFDHNLHQAMFEVEAGDHPPGTVAQVLQTGYIMHDRLLRPAMVGVTKSGGAGPRVDTTA